MIGLTQGFKASGLGKIALLAGLTIAAVAGSGINRAANAQDVVYGFTSNNILFSVPSAAPPGTLLSTATITGVAGTLLDIDFRPANGLLYGLGQSGGTFSLYTINTGSGAASLVTTLTGATATASSYDIDFNPAANALRIVGNNGDNFRVAAAQIGAGLGAVTVDTSLNGAATTGILGVAYNNNTNPSVSTTLFDIGTNGQLYRQGDVGGTPNSPNGGTLTAIGATGITGSELGFDVSGITNTAYVSNGTNLYRIDLTTGAQLSSTQFNGLVLGNVKGISATVAAPEPGSLVLLGTGLISMGGIAVRRKAKKA